MKIHSYLNFSVIVLCSPKKFFINNIITVNISNLPNNIQKVDIHFANEGRWPQLSVGPISPNPGPIFPIEDAAILKDVTISNSKKKKLLR